MAADETGTLYIIERCVDLGMFAPGDAAAAELPDDAVLWLTLGSQRAHGASAALTRWGEAQGTKFVGGAHRAISASNITEEHLEGETTTRIKRKPKK